MKAASSMATSEIADWLAVVDDDLKQVTNNLHGPTPTFSSAAYHRQQAAEKLVKATLVQANLPFPKTRHCRTGRLVAQRPSPQESARDLAEAHALRRGIPLSRRRRMGCADSLGHRGLEERSRRDRIDFVEDRSIALPIRSPEARARSARRAACDRQRGPRHRNSVRALRDRL